MMKILVTGATGFTGSYVVPALLKSGLAVRCFVRKTSDTGCLPVDRVDLASGDLDDMASLRKALEGVDALVNIASIGFGHAPDIVKAVSESGVKRALFISTTAIYTKLAADSKKVRVAAEKAITDSDLDYTIIRPTMIYGSSRDRNICRLIRFVKRYPAIPVFGDGTFLQQPLYVEDLADAIVKALSVKATSRRAYNVAGAEPITFDALVGTVSSLLGKNLIQIHLPAGAIVKALRFFEEKGLRFPITSEQVLRLNEDKVFDYSDAAGDFGFKPRTFSAGLKYEFRDMGLGAS
jgi:uncharacterized protein YbjT (DUF2867 family)